MSGITEPQSNDPCPDCTRRIIDPLCAMPPAHVGMELKIYTRPIPTHRCFDKNCLHCRFKVEFRNTERETCYVPNGSEVTIRFSEKERRKLRAARRDVPGIIHQDARIVKLLACSMNNIVMVRADGSWYGLHGICYEPEERNWFFRPFDHSNICIALSDLRPGQKMLITKLPALRIGPIDLEDKGIRIPRLTYRAY